MKKRSVLGAEALHAFPAVEVVKGSYRTTATVLRINVNYSYSPRKLEPVKPAADKDRGVKDDEDLDPGMAGSSAHREATRRHARAEQERASRSRLARAILGPSAKERRLASEERSWATGARGEELLAAALTKKCPEALFLNDRRMPKSRANIDHIAVVASGVYVIDAKRYRGKIEVRGSLFGNPKLMIAGRDRTKLIDGLAKQVTVVRDVLSDWAQEAPVEGCLCFVTPEGWLADVGLPAFRTLKINGYPLYHPRRLAKLLNESGPLAPEQIRRIHATLTQRLPPA